MKVLLIHVGNVISAEEIKPDKKYLYRKDLLTGSVATYLKHDIINADTQMQSIIQAGIDVEYGHFSNRKSLLNIFRTGKKIRQICEEQKIDLVHVLWGSTTGLLTCLFSPSPVVVSFCGSDLLGTKNAKGGVTISGRINRLLSRLIARLSAHNITKSEQMKQFLPRSVHGKTTVVPNGVDLSGFYPMGKEKARAKLEWSLHRKYILYFYTEGQMVKNPIMAEKVLNQVKVTFPDIVFVRATGIAHENLSYYYNAADVMILTSFHEGSNNSLKEAMACNLPVVSVPAGDAAERLRDVDHCYVMPDYQVRPFADKVIQVLQSGKRSNGAEHVQGLDTRSVAERVIEVYKKVLA